MKKLIFILALLSMSSNATLAAGAAILLVLAFFALLLTEAEKGRS